MDKRSQIPPSLPRDSPTTSYWQDPPDGSVADLRSTPELPSAADTVIIGSGITGAAVAWGLLGGDEDDGADGGNDGSSASSDSKDIVMLEARQACSGATGRNGGHTKAASYRTFLDHVARLGLEQATQIARLEYANVRAVHSFARTHGIACDSTPCDTVDVMYDAAEWAEAQEGVAALTRALRGGEAATEEDDGSRITDYALHSPEYVRSKLLCDDGGGDGLRIQGAVQYEAGSLSAYALTCGVLRLCLRRGLNLQTGTPALSLRRDGASDAAEQRRPWIVETPRGAISARRVVLATNGYTAHLLPGRLRGVVVPLRGQVIARRPGPGMPQSGLLTTYSFMYGNGYDYMVTRPAGSRGEGDFIIGGGLAKAPDDGLLEYGETDDGAVNETISAYLAGALPTYFGNNWRGAAGVEAADTVDDSNASSSSSSSSGIKHEWTGIMGFTPDGFPFVGHMPGGASEEGLWIAAAFQGHGMVLAWMCARALVCMMRGRDDDKLRGWFPDAFRVSEERLKLKFTGRLS